MSHRWSAAIALGSMALLAGCSGGDREDPAPAADPGGTPPPSVSAPVYTPFGKFPGGELLHTGIGEPLGVRVKPVDAMWTPELAGESAAAGSHFLAVYVATTGELADRAVKSARLTGLTLRITPASGSCGKGPFLKEGEIDCVTEAYPRSQLAEVADGEWRNFAWTNMSVMGSPLQRGETKIGVFGFSLPDTVDPTGFELCAPTEEHPVDTGAFPCVPVKAPENSRS
ncbi:MULTISPECIES: hypothetical protein [unclassified Streptomyces]|uniref:hypothetical protein n=1 Tax=unclassified Streptomyces TaxID=2593676 RepID=UPI0037959CCA